MKTDDLVPLSVWIESHIDEWKADGFTVTEGYEGQPFDRWKRDVAAGQKVLRLYFEYRPQNGKARVTGCEFKPGIGLDLQRAEIERAMERARRGEGKVL